VHPASDSSIAAVAASEADEQDTLDVRRPTCMVHTKTRGRTRT